MKKKRNFITFPVLNIKKTTYVFITILACIFTFSILIFTVSANFNENSVNTILSLCMKRIDSHGSLNPAQAVLSVSAPSLTFLTNEKPAEKTQPTEPTEYSTELPLSENISQSITYRSSEESGYRSIDGIYINNQTGKSLNLEKLLNKDINLTITQEPSVLILHTHTTESYAPSENYNYIPTETDRTLDSNFNMVAVGRIIYETLAANGINAVHDTSVNDNPSYSQSYSKSLKLAESYIKKYPSIKIVIDVHRDAIVTADGVKMRPVASLDTPTAQVMTVVGTDSTGLNHPNWETNLSFAIKLQHTMNSMYPTLARPINLRRQRFNQHVAPYAFILEVGTNGNTLDEAKEAASLFSESLISLLKEEQTQ